MSTLELYDYWMREVTRHRQKANCHIEAADRLEREKLADLGIGHVSHDPGFPGWRVSGVDGWFSTPREAAEAKTKNGG